VTLLTGDRVRLSDHGGGHYSFDVTAAPRNGKPEPAFVGNAGPDGFYVYPTDALPAVESGVLDRELFDVKYLAENGYADSKTGQLPVILQYPATRAAASLQPAAEALPASTVSLALPSIHSAGLKVAKDHATDFWTGIHGTATTLGGGIAKVWLDRKVKATLDESVPLIGAPQAWANGLDGNGVTVAVLDTGIDTGHPDFAGKLAQTRSFVPDVSSVQDGNGHGTHVASTVGGDGSASGGRYKGVAPGVKLAIGKVLSDDGTGDYSWIIAGMEWAATSGAKVVSMSLGGDPTDGTDPLSQAVDQLTASTGALFVVAAGNSGPTPRAIATPGSASAALTVSATDKSDKLPGFSSRGPRFGDSALKPDIAAPGVDIVAARAAGTAAGVPVDDHYTTLSGTSMATPHVAGAVAILAQQHPDWSPARLKAQLMSTTKDDGFTVYEQGAGRVDVARAVSQQVSSLTTSVDFAAVHTDSGSQSRQITYVNDSDHDVVLRLQSSLRAAMTRDSATQNLQVARTVTVPAHGQVRAAVSFDPRRLTPATYSGAIVATDTKSGTRLSTPIGAVLQAPLVTLTIRTLDRKGHQADGRTAEAHASTVLDVAGDGGALGPDQIREVEPGLAQVEIPAGTYAVHQILLWSDETYRYNFATLDDPEVVLTRDTTLVMDARKAVEESVVTPVPSEVSPASRAMDLSERTTAAGATYGTFESIPPQGRLLRNPTKRVHTGQVLASFARVLGAPEVTATVHGRHPVALHPVISPHDHSRSSDTSLSNYVSFEGSQTLPVVDVGAGSAAEIAGQDLHGKLVLVDGGEKYAINALTFVRLREAGVAGIIAWTSGPPAFDALPVNITLADSGLPDLELGVPYVSVHPSEARALRDELKQEAVTVTMHGTPQSPFIYQIAPLFTGQVPASLRTVVDAGSLVRIDTEYHAPADGAGMLWASAYVVTAHQMFGLDPRAPGQPMPGSRVEYVGPVQPGVVVHRSAWTEDLSVNETVFDVFDRPGRRTERWNSPPLTPGAAVAPPAAYRLFDPDAPLGTQTALGSCLMCRQKDTLWPVVTHTGGDGRSAEGAWIPAMRLFRNGVEVERQGGAIPSFHLPPEPATYRLEAEDSVTRTKTAWTYRSARVTRNTHAGGFLCPGSAYGLFAPCGPEPVVFVGYELGSGLALDNTVAAGREHTFTVTAYHSPSATRMPAVSGMRLWTSVDDGAHWIQAKVGRGHNGSYTVTARYPAYDATSGAVSLKAEAWDAAGSKVEQTTLRAFALRR